MGSSNILLNHQISAEIISLIQSSIKYCFLVTPYYKPWPLLNRTLEKAAASNKLITFIFRAGGVNEDILKSLNKQGFDIHLVERLHTKLYINENTAILTSMNLYDSSKENNYEVGYKISNAYESKQFKEEVIEKDILSLTPKLSLPGRYSLELQRLEEEKLEKEKKIQKEKEKRNLEETERQIRARRVIVSEPKYSYDNNYGFCIRCHTQIPLNIESPLCMHCFSIWAVYKQKDYEENYCHSCGKPGPATMSKPLCYDCYKDYKKSISF